jgi:hypothetical protein
MKPKRSHLAAGAEPPSTADGAEEPESAAVPRPLQWVVSLGPVLKHILEQFWRAF